MLFLERKFSQTFLKPFTEGNKSFLATLQGVQIFEHEQDARELTNYHSSNGIATIGIKSLLGDGLPWWISHTSYASIIEGVARANADESVEQIIFDVDSPGGFVSGWMPAALAIRDSEKPTKGIVGEMAASAAYMLISQADEIVATHELSTLGSIGVAAEYVDFSVLLERAGITEHIFTNDESKDKRPDVSTVAGRQIIQDGINDIYHVIEGMIAVGRNVSIDFLRENFGAGRVLLANDALSAKMVDNIKQNTVALNNDEIVEDVSEESMQMDIKTVEDLKASFGALCNTMCSDASKVAVQAAVKVERKRVSEWAEYVDVDPVACSAGIKGEESIDIPTATNFAIARNNVKIGENLVKDNPDDVDPPEDNKSEPTAEEKFEQEVSARRKELQAK